MVRASSSPENARPWQRALANAIRDPAELRDALGLDRGEVSDPCAGNGEFALRVPRSYLARMRAGDPEDPLLAQVWPSARERVEVDGYGTDPVGDRDAMVEPGVVHKYAGRALLVATGACGIHCRYCFRRAFPYAEANPRRDQWRAALAYIGADPGIEEVILSGGDPLSLPDHALGELAERIAAIPHVSTLRIHTRLPVVVPERVDEALCEWLGHGRLQKVVVLHANHANEIDDAVAAAAQRLRASTTAVLNQAVLLAGVNETAAAQSTLARNLFRVGVLPYYLHLLDPVRGAAHYEVPLEKARQIGADLAATLPGYLVPRLVREEPGRPGKTPITFDWDGANASGDSGAARLGQKESGIGT
jgi:EF-P beta-lysylation protein EpmB